MPLKLDFGIFKTKVVKQWMDMVYEVNAKPLNYDDLMEMLEFLTQLGYFEGAPNGKACDGTVKVIFVNYLYNNLILLYILQERKYVGEEPILGGNIKNSRWHRHF